MKRFNVIVGLLIVLVATMPIVNAELLSLTYDANGNLISGDGKFRVYDEFNRLIEVRNGTNSSAQLLEVSVWHPTQEKVLFKDVYEGGVKKERVFYFNGFTRVENASGVFNTTEIYQDGVLVAENTPQGKRFISSDPLGSSSLTTDSLGTPIENTTFDPYGNIISGGSGRFDQEDKEFSSSTGEYDYHFRKYNPSLKIFTQPDTLIENVYDPQLLNHYVFERNNPFSYTDPDGKEAYLILQNTEYFPDPGHLQLVIHDPDEDNYKFYEVAGPDYPGGEAKDLLDKIYAASGGYGTKVNSPSTNKNNAGTKDSVFPKTYAGYLELKTSDDQDRQMNQLASNYLANVGNYVLFKQDSTTFVMSVLSGTTIDSYVFDLNGMKVSSSLDPGGIPLARAVYLNVHTNQLSVDKGKLQRERILAEGKKKQK